MRTRLLVCALVLTVGGSAAAAQKEKDASRPPKKGDAIMVRGCLTGQALEASELGSTDITGAPSSGVTFRLTGDKTLLKQMRDEHDGKVVEVQGVLKSNLPAQSVPRATSARCASRSARLPRTRRLRRQRRNGRCRCWR